jgi:hypothetical protein
MQAVSGRVHDRTGELSERVRVGIAAAVRVRLRDVPVKLTETA